uniref:Uncharacterized protein n=1 Tax=Aegilops tauschii subsp. strangulata TaxID=200361 RepID=A0A453BKH5_AEGTS
ETPDQLAMQLAWLTLQSWKLITSIDEGFMDVRRECGIDYPENGLLPPDAQSWCQASFDPKQLLWEADQTSMTLDISKSNTGDAASKQDSAFKKENDVAKPPPSDLENRT